MIAAAAMQEDVDAVGLSHPVGRPHDALPRDLEALKKKGRNDVLVFGGGIIPDEDVPGCARPA